MTIHTIIGVMAMLVAAFCRRKRKVLFRGLLQITVSSSVSVSAMLAFV